MPFSKRLPSIQLPHCVRGIAGVFKLHKGKTGRVPGHPNTTQGAVVPKGPLQFSFIPIVPQIPYVDLAVKRTISMHALIWKAKQNCPQGLDSDVETELLKFSKFKAHRSSYLELGLLHRISQERIVSTLWKGNTITWKHPTTNVWELGHMSLDKAGFLQTQTVWKSYIKQFQVSAVDTDNFW